MGNDVRSIIAHASHGTLSRPLLSPLPLCRLGDERFLGVILDFLESTGVERSRKGSLTDGNGPALCFSPSPHVPPPRPGLPCMSPLKPVSAGSSLQGRCEEDAVKIIGNIRDYKPTKRKLLRRCTEDILLPSCSHPPGRDVTALCLPSGRVASKQIRAGDVVSRASYILRYPARSAVMQQNGIPRRWEGTDQISLCLAGRECSTHQQDRRFPWPSRGSR